MSHKNIRSAVITGASQGIGRAIAIALMENGTNAVLAGRSERKINKILEAYPQYAECLSPATLDMSDLDSIARFSADIANDRDRLDILINCAGVYCRGKIHDSSTDQLDELYAVNVRGTYALTQALLPLLIKAGGDIIFINSSIVQFAGADVGQFAATQHALKGIADSVRAEVNEQGVRVLSIYPGRTATPRQKDIHESESREYKSDKLLQPSDIAEIVVACLSLPSTAEVTELHIRSRHK